MAKKAQKESILHIEKLSAINEENCSCSVKSKIIEMATERFKHYGYNKTTIADIAKDCKMSAGNIYRYYESKLDIAVTIVLKTNNIIVMNVYDKTLKVDSARDRLRVFLFENLRITYKLLEQDPKLADMMIAIRKERPEIRRFARKVERKMIAEILEYGKTSKEFSVDCISSIARIVQCLIFRFRWSKLTSPNIELKRLETELEGTFEMIVTALGAGCFLEKIMRRHPKTKDEDSIRKAQHSQIILPKPIQTNAI